MKVAQNSIGKAYFFLYNPAWRGLFFFSFFFVGPGLDLNSWIKKRLVGKGWREFLFFLTWFGEAYFFFFLFCRTRLGLGFLDKKKVSRKGLERIFFFDLVWRGLFFFLSFL